MAERYTPKEMLAKLVAFPTVSRDSNLALVDWVEAYLSGHGVSSRRVYNEAGDKANLYALIGPAVEGGVILSGHTDVVPIDGQDWATDPFELVEKDGKLYGRGSCDMKGFDALALAMVPEALESGLKRPIQIEEVDQHARPGIGLTLDPELDPEGMTVQPKALVVFRHPREPVRGFDRELAEDLHGRASHRRSAPIRRAYSPHRGGYQPISDPPVRTPQDGTPAFQGWIRKRGSPENRSVGWKFAAFTSQCA